MSSDRWNSGSLAFGMWLNGAALTDTDADGNVLTDDTFLVLFNASWNPQPFTLPPASLGTTWMPVHLECLMILKYSHGIDFNPQTDSKVFSVRNFALHMGQVDTTLFQEALKSMTSLNEAILDVTKLYGAQLPSGANEFGRVRFGGLGCSIRLMKD